MGVLAITGIMSTLTRRSRGVNEATVRRPALPPAMTDGSAVGGAARVHGRYQPLLGEASSTSNPMHCARHLTAAPAQNAGWGATAPALRCAALTLQQRPALWHAAQWKDGGHPHIQHRLEAPAGAGAWAASRGGVGQHSCQLQHLPGQDPVQQGGVLHLSPDHRPAGQLQLQHSETGERQPRGRSEAQAAWQQAACSRQAYPLLGCTAAASSAASRAGPPRADPAYHQPRLAHLRGGELLRTNTVAVPAGARVLLLVGCSCVVRNQAGRAPWRQGAVPALLVPAPAAT